MRYVIGVDIGTTNTKAVAFTPQGRVLADARASYASISTMPDHHELDPAVLLKAVFGVMREAVERTVGGGAGLPSGISLSCAMHSLIVVDGEGSPLTLAITWADLRSKEYAKALKGTEAGQRIYRHTGTPVHAMSPLCKLLWFKENERDVYARAGKFISIKEYIWWHLFGKYQVDHSLASATGLFNIYSFEWFQESLDITGIDASRLSDPVPCTHIEDGVSKAGRQALGFGEEWKIPFVIGGSDGCMANLGSNAIRPGEAALTIGTSGAIRMMAARPEYDSKERVFNYILTRDLYVCGGATNNGGAVVQWYIGLSNPEADLSEALGMAGKATPGSDGLLFLPYIYGERAPIWNEDARGLFFGMHGRHEQAHFIRSVLEGISYSLYQIGLSLEETNGPIRHIYASGGFIRSPLWLQMMADIFNKPVSVTNVADASAIGACITGFYALGMISRLEEARNMISIQQSYEPDAATHLIYKRSFGRFVSLYEHVKDLFRAEESMG